MRTALRHSKGGRHLYRSVHFDSGDPNAGTDLGVWNPALNCNMAAGIPSIPPVPTDSHARSLLSLSLSVRDGGIACAFVSTAYADHNNMFASMCSKNV